ncbi:DNA sulfur modification protein DndB [Sphingomonas sp. C3-2]|uniref:DNA sulfur modification protein DndB n=1 Tax=Sphingomonas sp. C3-2 TaxID=3062169 RepID=UPI00294ACE7E|nr:DNA sulfur modification protein DndB [Sphingomonas sp. C3-2]WOK36184.1 DNA sulfur modification protein DndB [Sphingomonas sp. C3-2]
MRLLVNCYRFAAIRGVQAGRAYYVIMVPFGAVERLFTVEEELPPQLMAQRALAAHRVPSLANYILDNGEDYVLAALSASIDGRFVFYPFEGGEGDRSIGTVEIDIAATLTLHDGQHRRAAIIEALRERPHLGRETVAVTLFPHRGIEHAQQMFVDLNQHGVKPSRSLRLFYDHRDEAAQLTKAVIEAIPVFRALTDLVHVTPRAGSRKLFGLSSVHSAMRAFLSDLGADSDAAQEAALAYWTAVADEMPDWQAAARLALNPAELRRDMIHAHGLALEALAVAGARLLQAYPERWRDHVSALRSIDWARSNTALWEGRALVGGRVNRSRTSVLMTAELIWSIFASQDGGVPPRPALKWDKTRT